MTFDDWLLYVGCTPAALWATYITVALWLSCCPAHPVSWFLAIAFTISSAITAGIYTYVTLHVLSAIWTTLRRALRPHKP